MSWRIQWDNVALYGSLLFVNVVFWGTVIYALVVAF